MWGIGVLVPFCNLPIKMQSAAGNTDMQSMQVLWGVVCRCFGHSALRTVWQGVKPLPGRAQRAEREQRTRERCISAFRPRIHVRSCGFTDRVSHAVTSVKCEEFFFDRTYFRLFPTFGELYWVSTILWCLTVGSRDRIGLWWWHGWRVD